MALEDTTFFLPTVQFFNRKEARKQKQNNNKTFFINEKQPLGKTQPQRLEITLSSSSATSPTRFFVPPQSPQKPEGRTLHWPVLCNWHRVRLLSPPKDLLLAWTSSHTPLKQDHARTPVLSAGSAMEGGAGLQVCSSNKLLANTDTSEQTPCSEPSDLSHNFSDRTPDSAHECWA